MQLSPQAFRKEHSTRYPSFFFFRAFLRGILKDITRTKSKMKAVMKPQWFLAWTVLIARIYRISQTFNTDSLYVIEIVIRPLGTRLNQLSSREIASSWP